MHLSAGIPAYTMLRYTLHGAASSPNILLNHSLYDGEIVSSRDDIQYLTEGQTLHLSSDYSLYGDSMRQTTWSGFRLDEAMSPLVLFRVARMSTYSVNNSFIPMDKLLTNIGQGWDLCNNQFVVPRSGNYFMSWSSASAPNTRHRVDLAVNGLYMGRTFIYEGWFNGVDTSSQSVLLPLVAGDVVKLYTTMAPVYSDENYQLSLTGFLYEPVHGQNVAWTLTFPNNTNVEIFGPSVVNFTEVILNNGSVWDGQSAAVIIPTSGIYFLKLSGAACPANYKLNLILSVNGQLVMNVMEKSGAIGVDCNLRSKSLITRLQQGDELIVTIPTGFLANTIHYDVSFIGYLISV